VGGGVAAFTRSNAAGEFLFVDVPGSYVIELVNEAGRVVAIGPPFPVAAGEAVATFLRNGSMVPAPLRPSGWELGVGAIGAWRHRSRGGAPGAGMMFGYGVGRRAVVAEFSGIRRAGHNDWRALGGLRLGFVEGARAAVFGHVMAGSMIRSGRSGLALAAGLGVEAGGAGRAAFRLQADVTRDRAEGRRATGVRASTWVVVR